MQTAHATSFKFDKRTLAVPKKETYKTKKGEVRHLFQRISINTLYLVATKDAICDSGHYKVTCKRHKNIDGTSEQRYNVTAQKRTAETVWLKGEDGKARPVVKYTIDPEVYVHIDNFDRAGFCKFINTRFNQYDSLLITSNI